MGRAGRGYSSYRGRRTLNDILKWVALGLLVLVVAVVGCLMWWQEYIVFTDKGLEFRPPFSLREEEDPEGPGDVSVVIQPDQSGEEIPVTEPEAAGMRAVQLPVSALLEGTALGQLEQAGADALILEMKDQEGQLGWLSQQTYAQRAQVNAGAEVNQILEQWNQGEVYTVALVCCFRDNTIPYFYNSTATRVTGGNWRDELGLRWLSPDSQEARDYLAALCGELAQLGFDEILLDCCSFPTQGNLQQITPSVSYQSGEFDQTMGDFLAQVKEAVAPYGTILSLRMTRQNLIQNGVNGGLTAQVAEEYAQRIWMEEDGEQPSLVQLLTQAGISQGEERLVEVVTQLEEENFLPQGVFRRE